jgi:hypothetical protein
MKTHCPYCSKPFVQYTYCPWNTDGHYFITDCISDRWRYGGYSFERYHPKPRVYARARKEDDNTFCKDFHHYPSDEEVKKWLDMAVLLG